MEHVVIIGAGLVGTLLAICLAQANYRVTVYERMPDPRKILPKSNRSVSITMAVRGLRVLDAVGVGEAVRQLAFPIYGRIIHDEAGDLTYQPYGAHNEANYAIRRADLNRILLDAADQHPQIDLVFNHKCVGIDLTTNMMRFQQLQSEDLRRVQAEYIFAADGAFSLIRHTLQQQKRFDYSQQFLNYGYREITLLPTADGKPPFFSQAFHIWPRTNLVLYGFANLDGSFTLSLLLPHEGEISNATITTEPTLRQLFATQFCDVLPLLDPVIDEYFTKPFEAMVTIKCFPWVYQDRLALIGDACHAILPFYGQGANAGFEDCAVLMSCLQESAGNLPAALHNYERQRKPNTDAIADLCVAHFTEIMDQVSDPQFQLRKKIERSVTELFPERTSLYHNISFTSIPYTEAIRIEQQHRLVIDQLLQVEGIETKLHDPDYLRWMKENYA